MSNVLDKSFIHRSYPKLAYGSINDILNWNWIAYSNYKSDVNPSGLFQAPVRLRQQSPRGTRACQKVNCGTNQIKQYHTCNFKQIAGVQITIVSVRSFMYTVRKWIPDTENLDSSENWTFLGLVLEWPCD